MWRYSKALGPTGAAAFPVGLFEWPPPDEELSHEYINPVDMPSTSSSSSSSSITPAVKVDG